MQNPTPLIRQASRRPAKKCVDDRIIVNLRYAPGCMCMQTTQPQQKKAYQNNQGDATSFDSTG
jgi:hypothetical protein